MENLEVAQVFEEVADLLEIQGANPFRVRAYRNAARTIRDLSESLADICANSDRKLEELAGIGQDLAGKIKSIVESGDLPLRQELRGQVPAGVRDLLNVPGLGPKRALVLHQKLGIGSLDQLRQATQEHRIQGLPGFGVKTEEKILASLEDLQQSSQRVGLAEATVYADAVSRHLRKTPGLRS